MQQIKYKIQKRSFTLGPKKLTSIRLPERLLAELERIASKKGYTTSELIVIALDQLARQERKQSKKS